MDEQPSAIPILLAEADETPILYANQFVLQEHQGEFILTVAQFAPPLLVGDAEEQREQLKQVTFIKSRVVGRFAVNRECLAELAAVIDRLSDNSPESGRKDEDRA